jgi:carbamoyl-phosphate synthase large subunit
MVNCNPETVSTDYDVSDRLYFEPLTVEDVMNIVANERPVGVIVQFGGQTPLKIAGALALAGIPILGTPQESIDLAEDRGLFGRLLEELGIACPEYGLATTAEEAVAAADRIGYPLLVRPSYVLGGRAMRIVYAPGELEHYMHHAVRVSPEHPVLIDKFLEDAIEVDVDAVCDGEEVYIGAVMQQWRRQGCTPVTRPASYRPSRLARARSRRCTGKRVSSRSGSVSRVSSTCSSHTRTTTCTSWR